MSVVCGDMTNNILPQIKRNISSYLLMKPHATSNAVGFFSYLLSLCMYCSTVCKRWHASSRVITRPSGSLGCRWPAALKLPLQSRGPRAASHWRTDRGGEVSQQKAKSNIILTKQCDNWINVMVPWLYVLSISIYPSATTSALTTDWPVSALCSRKQ